MKPIYKYVLPERVDILERCKIRFTQPKYLNDPFDLHISFKKFISKVDYDKHIDAEKLYQKIISKFNESLASSNLAYSFDDFLSRQGKTEEEFKQLFTEQMNSFSSVLTTENDFIKEFFANEMNKSFGVLSLTESPDSIPMWAHYANVHQGFVLIFDSENNFFNGDVVNDKDFGKIIKVNYPEKKTTIETLKEIKSDPLFQKHKSWSYENEWRMLLPLEKRAEIKYPDIYLFDIPPEAIHGVIFGFRCEKKLKDFVVDLKNNSPKMNHLDLLESAPNLDDYKMNVYKIS